MLDKGGWWLNVEQRDNTIRKLDKKTQPMKGSVYHMQNHRVEIIVMPFRHYYCYSVEEHQNLLFLCHPLHLELISAQDSDTQSKWISEFSVKFAYSFISINYIGNKKKDDRGAWRTERTALQPQEGRFKWFYCYDELLNPEWKTSSSGGINKFWLNFLRDSPFACLFALQVHFKVGEEEILFCHTERRANYNSPPYM